MKGKNTERVSIKSLLETLKDIFRLSLPYKTRFFSALLLVVVGSAIWLTVPLGLRSLLDAVFEQENYALLNKLSLGLIGLFLTQAIFTFGGNYHIEWVGERVITDLRNSIYAHLQKLSFSFFANRRLGELTSRLSNDVGSIRVALTDSLPQIITISITMIGSVSLMVVLNWRLSLVIFLTVPVVTVATRFFGKKIRALSKNVQDKLADTTAIAEETLSAIRVVKSFTREEYEINRYKQATEELFATSRHKIVLTQVFWAGVGLMFMGTLVMIFWYGGREVLSARLSAGDLVAFIVYALNISRSVGQASRLYTAVNTAAGASERLFELKQEKIEQDNKFNKKNSYSRKTIKGRVEFDQLCFSYEDGKQVLDTLSFEINDGQTVALVGESGAGKTTLLNLIPRFFNPTKGEIRVDGVSVNDWDLSNLRSFISVVPQETHLFGTSIYENIRYGKLDATKTEIEQAAIDANAHEFITQMSDGYQSLIGEKGVKLSGGQRQRIAIARAILRNPSILLLDEATSSLDSVSERQVQQALERLMENRTTLVIAHRLSTIQHADCILVLERGTLAESGTHEELLYKEGIYANLYELQFSEKVGI
ncbi:MAG: ABC transporter transmembrane domain-containing protein [Bacteroidota bacterium]|nr:ABC transporter transmembrane domain-containing protein [Bacteroidota bacterium]